MKTITNQVPTAYFALTCDFIALNTPDSKECKNLISTFAQKYSTSVDGIYKYCGYFNEFTGFGVKINLKVEGSYMRWCAGFFKNKEMHSVGVKIFANGGIDEGEFKDDKLNGQSKRIFQDGGYDEGQFVANNLCGKGIKKFANGQVYEGTFEEDKLKGEGRVVLKDGTQRIGNFDGESFYNDSWEGKKVFVDGRIEIGKFVKGEVVLQKKMK